MNETHDNNEQSSAAVVFLLDKQGQGKAIRLEKVPAGYEISWRGSSDEYTAAPADRKVLCAESANTAYYRFELPVVDENQIDQLVKVQADSLLPVAVDQMQLAWRSTSTGHAKTDIVLAAARKDVLKKTVTLSKAIKAEQILTECQGLVKAWKELFSGQAERTVLLRVLGSKATVVLIENFMLTHVVVLEAMGVEQLADASADQIGLFVHDLRGVMDMFKIDLQDSNIFMLGEKQGGCGQLIGHLQQAGIAVTEAIPDMSVLKFASTASQAEVCSELELIGAAMAVVDGDDYQPDLFAEINNASTINSADRVNLTPVKSAVIMLVMLVIYLFTASVLDSKSLKKLSDPKVDELLYQVKIKKLVTKQRPDILGLLVLLNENLERLKPDKISYKKQTKSGKANVSITSFAGNNDQLYKLQEKLEKLKLVSNVEIEKSSIDQKKNRVNFTMTFRYTGKVKD